jgi:hypothetical protein
MAPRPDPRYLPVRSSRNTPPKTPAKQPEWPDEDSDEDPEYVPTSSDDEGSGEDEYDLEDSFIDDETEESCSSGDESSASSTA